MNKRFYCFIWIAFLSVGKLAHGQELTVIELRNRQAAEVIPILKPLLDANTSLTGTDYRLIVRGNATEIARIREALAVLDRAPRQLLISVRYDTQAEMARDQISLAGQAGSNGGHLVVRTARDRRIGGNSEENSVRVLEGQAAMISSGASVPTIGAIINDATSGNTGVILGQRDVASGFRVRPRVNGDAVIVDIESQQERWNGDGSVAAQRMNTSIGGRLGQWISIGGTNELGHSDDTALAAHRTQTAGDQRQVWLKVDLLSE